MLRSSPGSRIGEPFKRDLEEMKADVESAKKPSPSGQMDIVALAELEQNSEAAGGGGTAAAGLSQGLAPAPQAPRSSRAPGPCISRQPPRSQTSQPAARTARRTRKTKKSTWTIEQRLASSTAPWASSDALPPRTGLPRGAGTSSATPAFPALALTRLPAAASSLSKQ